MKELLIKLGACKEAKEWAADKTWEEIYNTCHSGSWLLWLFKATNPNDFQLLILASGHCANTCRHLMKDEINIKAVDAAIAFGEGKISKEELDDAAAYAASAADISAIAANSVDAAYYAARAAYYAASAAYYAAYAAAYAAGNAAYAAYAAVYAYAAAESAYSAREENQKLTADICRKYLPIEIWNIEP